MSPQGFPKKAFSALWAIRAMTTLSTAESLKSSEKIFPIRTEKAAEELWGRKPQLQEEHLVSMRKLAQSTVAKVFELLHRE